eukprot:1231864-Pyramimonas_sp.AAC.1
MQVRREHGEANGLAEGEGQQGAREDNTRPEPPCGGVQPDIVILEGWQETAEPPTCPVTYWESPEGQRGAVRVVLSEVACTSDLRAEDTVIRKRKKHDPLIQALWRAGWNMAGETHVVTAGVRGTVPNSNKAALGCLEITTKREQHPVQRAIAREAMRHLNIIVRQYRKLSGRGGKKLGGGSDPDQRPSCANIPRSQDLAESRLDR